MQSALYVGLSAQVALEKRLQTIANNVANDCCHAALTATGSTLVLSVAFAVILVASTFRARCRVNGL